MEKGHDIDAACGQLRLRSLRKNQRFLFRRKPEGSQFPDLGHGSLRSWHRYKFQRARTSRSPEAHAYLASFDIRIDYHFVIQPDLQFFLRYTQSGVVPFFVFEDIGIPRFVLRCVEVVQA